MAGYLVNKRAQPNGDHEVHTYACSHLPDLADRLLLGDFPTCQPAVEAAKLIYPLADGCAYCCPACNKR